jgi:lipoyl-dependent peroxiredoxin
MSVATHEATIACEGALARGSGTPSSGSGALEQLPIIWASRTEQPDAKTYEAP